MKEIGEYLRQVRTEKNITLDAIQETTKIRKHYLEAIENGNFDAIPGEVYRKGFLVNYANAIGLDGQEVLARYNRIKEPQAISAELEIKPEIKKEAEPKSVKTNNTEQEPAKKKTTRIYLKNSTNLWIFAAIVLVILVAWVVVPMIQDRTREMEASNFKNSSEVTTAPTPKPVQNTIASPSESPEASATPDMVSTQLVPAPVMVSAQFSENVWVRVTQDGESVYGADGETFGADSPVQIWKAQKEITITIGNSGGIKLELNGKDLGKIGERGMSRTIVLTPEGLVNQ